MIGGEFVLAFEGLSEKLGNVFKKMRGKGVLTEKDVRDSMREVRLALLEADVNFKVVKEFVAAVTEKAVGEDVLKGLNPAQQVVKIVRDELTSLMGEANAKLTFSSQPPTVFMLVGLQGAGKTTACGKIAAQLRKQGKHPLMAACDVYRPAAVKQLQVVGANYNIPVFEMGIDVNPVKIAETAVETAKKNGNDVLIIDTAGRLHVDDALMSELTEMKRAVKPMEILLVVDALTGQDAVNVAESFNNQIGVDGIILSKLDSDARGGAALSVRKATDKPIKFIGMGEKIDDLEPFHPDRMASRILGMGDIETLIDKAVAAFDNDEAAKTMEKLKTSELDLDDFLLQMQRVKKMGSIKKIADMIPGLGKLNIQDADMDETVFAHTEAIVLSMTRQERRNPEIINGSRRKRIAAGCGQTVQDVNRLLKQFEEMRKMIKQFTQPNKKGKFKLPF